MYNEDIKNEFINGYTKSPSLKESYKAVFSRTERYEREWGADICTQPKEVVEPIVGELVGLRTSGKITLVSMLRAYARWCIVKKIPNAKDDLLMVDPVGFEQFREKTVASPSHLEKYLNAVFDPTEQCTVGCTYRCFYWLAYSGMNEADILKVKTSDVDFSTMKIRYDGREYDIYAQAVPALRNCIELKQFLVINPLYSKKVWKDRTIGDTLIRGLRPVNIRPLRTTLNRYSTKKQNDGSTKLRLSYYRVWLSGVFYRAYLDEQEGIRPDFRAVVDAKIGDKQYKLDSGNNTQDSKRKQMAWTYAEDYRRWKLAYSV